jgi:Zn-dependent metalloprotease
VQTIACLAPFVALLLAPGPSVAPPEVAALADAAPTAAWSAWLGSVPDLERVAITWSRDKRHIRSAHGQIRPPVAGVEPRKRADDLLRDMAPAMALRFDLLRHAGTDRTTRRTVFRYQQTLGGLPVEGKQVVVSVRKDGAIVGFEGDVARFHAEPTPVLIAPSEAVARAYDAVGLVSAPGTSKVKLEKVILDVLGTPVRAFRVPVAALPHGLYQVYVRADDGRVVWVRNRMMHLRAPGASR